MRAHLSNQVARECRFDLLRVLNRDHGKTIVMVTHDPHAAATARRVLHLDKGQLTAKVAA